MPYISQPGGTGSGAISGVTITGTAVNDAVPVASSSSAGTWALPHGHEFDYVELNTNLTITATTATTAQSVCGGNAVTYDGSTRIKIEFCCLDVQSGTAGNLIYELYDGSTDLGMIGILKAIVTNGNETSVSGATFLTPSAASHTYAIKAWKSAATGTYQINAGSAFSGSNPTVPGPTWYRITKA